MATKRARGLSDEHRAFVVQQLACFSTPKEVADALNEEFGLKVTPQAVERYDPNKRAGARLAKQWKELFKKTRKSFLKHIEVHVPEANKAVRIAQLAHAARAFKGKGNYVAMADMLEKIAKEVGNVHTNRRELTGKDGKPIEYRDMTEEQVNRELANALAEAGLREADVMPGEGNAVH